MPRPSCQRAWEAEALEDGQLSDADRASFERHMATCMVCTREVEDLASLRETMRRVTRAPPSALVMRRMRGALLQQAHHLEDRGNRTPQRVRTLVVAFVTLVAFAGVVGAMAGHRRSRGNEPVALPGAATFDVVNIDGAVVTSRTEGEITRAVLSDGTAGFHIDHVAVGRRFLVMLPDGEAEVRGTRFVVGVRDARTQSVEVSEGAVVLRLRNTPDDTLIGAGERWSAPPLAQATAASAAEPPPPLRNPPSESRGRGFQHGQEHGRVGEPGGVSLTGQTSDPTLKALAPQRFADGVSAFEAGNFAQADLLLENFIRDFPGDERCEDAGFLRAMSHARMGDAAGAADLAQAYLRAFPGGLRRREAEQLVGKR
jgi:ferric-dicitrate binding protein FerR (iron transport regulator)